MSDRGQGLRAKLSWCAYDVANSAFSLVMVTAFLPVYFREAIAADLQPGHADALWGYTIALSMGIVAVTSPWMGALADRRGWKKRLLFAYIIVGVCATAAWMGVDPSRAMLGLALFVLANIAFEGSLVFYDALLVHLVNRPEVGRWSGYGWSMGYAGSLGCLALALLLIQAGEAIWVFALVAAWWLVWSIPLLLAVKEPRSSEPSGQSTWTTLRLTFGAIRANRDLSRFFVAFFLFNDGIATTVAFAALYATQTLGFSAEETIVLIGAVQITGALGAFSLGFVADRVGHARTIVLTLVAWCGLVLAAYFVTTQQAFWWVALGVGLVMGGTQSASRGLLAAVAQDHAGKLFGFKAVAGKFSAVLGPLLFGVVSQATGDQRLALLAVGIFFVIGLALMVTVDEERARQAGVSV